MIIIYILLLFISLLPLWKAFQFIRLEERIRKNGISAKAVVSGIRTQNMGSSTRRVELDDVCFQYQSRATGQWHQSNQRTKKNKYKRLQELDILYLEEKPDKLIVQGTKREYWGTLLLCIIILVVAIIAVYKINEQLNTG